MRHASDSTPTLRARHRVSRRARTALAVALTIVGGPILTSCAKDAAPQGVIAVTLADPRDHWANSGFTQLVPPVHLPSSDHQIDQVEIWAKIPDGAVIDERPRKDGAPPALVFPPGSVLDRVEYENFRGERIVVDVRGTTIAPDGSQRFHVYRRGDAGMFGFEWARDDAGAHQRATAALRERLSQVSPGKAMAAEQREKFLATVQRQNECASCHALSRPTNTTQEQHGLVNRGTDGSGFFTPWTIFADAVPLEPYGAHDRSETDRYIEIECSAASPTQINDAGRVRCESGAVPLGRYDLRAALDAHDPRALQICTARRYLADHSTPAIRQRFAHAVAECETPPVTDSHPPG